MNNEEIMDLIETERVRKGLSFRQLGAAAGLSHATFHLARKHGKSMEYESVIRLLEAVGYRLKAVKK